MSIPEHLVDVEARAPAVPHSDTPPPVRARRSPTRVLGWVGAALVALLVLVAGLAPVLARHDPVVPSALPYQRPSVTHPLGTNDVGQDLFAQLLHGTRVSLAIGLLAALVAVSVGLVVALLAGYHRGRVETVLMRLVDLTLAFPFLVLVIVLAAFFGRGLLTTVLVIAAVIWARPARVLRSQAIKLREVAHLTAAQAMGATSWRCIGRHLLPRVAPLAAAQFVRAANIAVLIEASLAFLGLGDPNRVSWGTTLYFANARNAFLTEAWTWWILPPGLALTVAIVGFAFLGYAVEEWADPRLAGKALGRSGRARGRKRGAPPGAVPAQAAGTLLEVRDLRVEYRTDAGPLRAVDGVSFTLGPGRIIGLVGESGSGKSTVAMAVTGLLRPPARAPQGAVLLHGRDLRALPRHEMARLRGRQVALVPQSAMNALNPAYTLHHQVTEAAALTRPDPAAARAKAHELLDLVGIPPARHGAFPHELSGGMRQRVVIAMAIANEPSLLVADEPVTGLDVVTQARVLRLLLDLQARLRMAILLISHDLPLVSRVADDLLVMYAGRIVEAGPTAVVTGGPAHPYTRELLRAFPAVRGPRRRLAAIEGSPPDLSTPPCGCRFHPRCPDASEACKETDPALVALGGGQCAACIRHSPQ